MITDNIKALEVTSLIIITAVMPKRNQLERLQELEKQLDCNIEVFTIEELQFNVTKHYLVPKHTVLTSA